MCEAAALLIRYGCDIFNSNVIIAFKSKRPDDEETKYNEIE
jgi:hypothetical protein